jgi:hypothetical protein
MDNDKTLSNILILFIFDFFMAYIKFEEISTLLISPSKFIYFEIMEYCFLICLLFFSFCFFKRKIAYSINQFKNLKERLQKIHFY